MTDETLLPLLEGKPALDYPCGHAPAPGAAIEIAPGVMWIRMPMPLRLMDHVNLWAIHDGSGWAVFDGGLQTTDTTLAWYTLSGEDGALAHGGLTRLFVTHMHPDHAGLAGWLTRRFGCQLWMTRTEYLACRVLVASTGQEMPDEAVRFYKRAGWNDMAIDLYRTSFGSFARYVHALPESYHRLRDGENLRIGDHMWKVVIGAGHSPEHACFHSPALKLLISGDQVLPRISSNVSVCPSEPDADPTSDWLASLDKLAREIPDDVLVLPGHGEPFYGLHARLDHLRCSQQKALDRLRRAMCRPRRVVDVFPHLFSRPIGPDPHLMEVATGESVARLNYLQNRDEVEMELDADGVAWYHMKQ